MTDKFTEKKIKALQDAILEANRFIDKAEKAIDNFKCNDMPCMISSKHTASAKRSSMDLTRALVEVRK